MTCNERFYNISKGDKQINTCGKDNFNKYYLSENKTFFHYKNFKMQKLHKKQGLE